MLPIQPLGDRPGLAALYGANAAPATTPAAPPGIAVDVSPLGQLLGTLALAQKRLDGLGATAAGVDPAGDLTQLAIAAGEVVEAFNLGRTLALPGAGGAASALPDQLTQALARQQEGLRRIGIDTAADTRDARLDVDSGRLLSAFATDRSGTLSTLGRAAASFAEAGDAMQAPEPDAADKTPVAGAPATPAPQQPLPPDTAPPDPPQPTPTGTLPADATTPPDQAAANRAADAAAADAAAALTRQQVALDEEARRQAAALDADALARQRLDREAEAMRVEETRRQALLAEQLAAERLARQRSEEIAREDAARQAQRQLELQASTGLDSASQATLTQESRQAAYRLDVARQVASEQVAAQQDAQDQRVTQDQRLMEARAAALRQLTSTQEQDLAAQALADRMDQERREAAASALTESERQAQERLLAARRAAAGLPDQPPDSKRADEAVRAQERERELARLRARDTATRRDDLLAGGVSARADIDRTDATTAARAEPVQSTLASMEDVLRQAQDDSTRTDNDAARAAEVNRANAANSPTAPNAADPAVAAAIAAQRLAGGVPGGAGAAPPAPPPRVEPVPAVRPVARVTNVPALEGQGAAPRRGT